MKATVVTSFNDAVLKRIFEVGEEYPAKEVGEERVELLSKPHPKTKKVYIYVEKTDEVPSTEQQDAEEQQADEAPVADAEEQQVDEVPEAEKPAPKRTRKTPAKKDGE